jgi:hypothetical protein
VPFSRAFFNIWGSFSHRGIVGVGGARSSFLLSLASENETDDDDECFCRGFDSYASIESPDDKLPWYMVRQTCRDEDFRLIISFLEVVEEALSSVNF